MNRPLAGLRVVELASEIAGPYCAKLLVDLGADVRKVEPRQVTHCAAGVLSARALIRSEVGCSST